MTSMGLGLLIEEWSWQFSINCVVGFYLFFCFVLFLGFLFLFFCSKVLTCLEDPGLLELNSSRKLNNFKTIFLFDSNQFLLPFWQKPLGFPTTYTTICCCVLSIGAPGWEKIFNSKKKWKPDLAILLWLHYDSGGHPPVVLFIIGYQNQNDLLTELGISKGL